MTLYKKIIFLLLTILSCNNLYGQDGKSITFITDQDFLCAVPSKNEDRNYTQGTSITLSDPTLYYTILFAPFRGFNNIREKIFLRKSVPQVSSISILGTAFTPRIIDSINPIIGDRPFAFLLATSYNSISRIGDKEGYGSDYESITVNIGLLGTNIGYDFQSFAHTYIVTGRPKNPIGWNNQISKGGKVALLLNYERTKLFSLFTNPIFGSGIDGSVNIGSSVGYYKRIYAGAYFRFGKINSKTLSSWTYFGNALATADRIYLNTNINQDTTLVEKKCEFLDFEFFGFSRFTNTLMFRNSLLQGQQFGKNDIYTLEDNWIKTYFFDIDFGLALGLYWKNKNSKTKFVRITGKNTIRSAEFDSGIFPKRKHIFGSFGFQFYL